MTRETKVGLFVGLAFIILFAVVISERGGSDRKTSPPAFVDATHASDPSRTAQLHANAAGGHDGRLPVERALGAKPAPVQPPVIAPPANEVRRIADASRPRDIDLPAMPEPAVSDPPPMTRAPGSEIAGPVVPPSSNPGPTTLVGNTPRKGVIPPSLGSDRSGDFEDARNKFPPPRTTPPSGVDTVVQRNSSAEPPRDTLANGPLPGPDQGKNVETRVPASTDKPKDDTRLVDSGPRHGVTHHIRPGESLAKISKVYYGTQSKQVVMALFDANRDVLSDPTNIPADKDIMIPILAGYEDRFGKATEPTTAPRPGGQPKIPAPIATDRRTHESKPGDPDGKKSDRPDKTKPARVYAVRPRDTLRKIAARELGDPNRFREIFQLNRDQLDSPDDVDPGIELKLPPRNRPRADQSGTVLGVNLGSHASSRTSRR